MKSAIAAVAAPSFGPAVVTVLGADVPILAFGLSVAGLLLARSIAPPPLRKLNGRQEVALTVLLLIILFLIVTGQLPLVEAEPLGAGMAVIWGVGLGFSGLLIVEFFGERVMAVMRAAFGKDTK
jgi:hypothetical protein